ncbi:hemagglutinin repeat-containing protein, partial [Jinshanibacter sp. LJY008]
AAGITAEDSVALVAGRDVNLTTAESREYQETYGKRKKEINESVRQQGTEILSGDKTTIIAGRDVTAEAANVVAGSDITLHAGRDVTLTTATESDYSYKEEKKSSSGFLSKKTTHTISEDSATREKGTLLSGDNVTVTAGNDLTVKGSSVVGDADVRLNAGNDVNIIAATDTDTSWRFKETKKSGVMGTGGIGITIGTSKTTHDRKEAGTTQSQSASTIGSTGGNVSIAAGNQVRVSGSDVIANRDISITGDSVMIDPGHDKRTVDQKFEQKSTGITVALSGAVGGAINNAVSAAQSAKSESDDRLAALQGVKAALSGVQAAQGVELAQANGDPNNGIGVSISLSHQKSKSEQHHQSDNVSGSTINAGNNLSITATGNNKTASGSNSGDIIIAGSQVKAGGDTSLSAKNDVLLTGAANTQKTTGSNSSSGGNVGISFGGGSNGAGLSIFAGVNSSKGKEKGNGTEWTETTVDSGKSLTITSGRDTTLNGALVSADKVTVDAGRNLTISSQQDSEDYDSKQHSVAAGGSFTFGSMTGSGYLNASQSKMTSDYDSVQEQSGIYAGKGGFDITVGNHTQLDGGVISSTATEDKNNLNTGTLGWTDIHNEADYKVQHQGVGISGGAMPSQGGDFTGNMAGGMLTGMNKSGHAEGTTQSAIANGNITIRDEANQKQDIADLSRDTENANGSIGKIFDKEKEQKRLETVQTIGEIGQQAADIVRTQGEIAKQNAMKDPEALAAAKTQLVNEGNSNPSEKDIAEQAGRTAMQDYGTGSSLQRGISGATAAIQALAGGGNIGAILSSAAAPELAHMLKPLEGDKAASAVAHAILGAVNAELNGGNAAAGAAGAATGELIGNLIIEQLYPGISKDKLSEEQKQTVSLLSTLAAGLAGGVTGDSSSSALAGAQAGKNAVENNALSPSKNEALMKALDDQKAGNNLLEASQNIVRLTNEDRASNILLGKYQSGQLMTDSEKQELAGQLNQYGLELQILYGYSPEKAAEAVRMIANNQAFMATDAEAKAYNEAVSYLKGYSVQSGQAAIGTEVLLALPGGVGTAARASLAAGGAYQAGTGIGQAIDGKYGESALNIGLGTAAIFGGLASQNIISKAENALSKGQVTYEFGAKPNGNELRAGSTFSELGYDVTYKATASDKGISGVRTPDLWVNGIGKVDVYTPQTVSLGNIVKAIEKKDSQTTAVLTQIDLSLQDMQSMSSRLWGKPSVKNINTVFFQDSKGQIYRFERPASGAK